MITLGVFVLWARPGRATNRAFFLFAAGMGTAVALVNFVSLGSYPGARAIWVVTAVANLAAVIGLVWLAWEVARPTRRAMWWAAAVVAPAAVAMPVSQWAVPTHDFAGVAGVAESLQPWFTWTYTVSASAVLAASLFFVAVGVLAGSQARRRHLAVMSGGIWVWPALSIGILTSIRVGLPTIMTLYGCSVIVAALVLANLRGPDARSGRNLTLWLLGLPVVSYFVALQFGPDVFSRSGLWGLGRIVAASIIGFSIVRHQILGFDVKVRWTLSRSTVAAAFIAVFFVVSELTATLLGATRLGPIAGILGAGVLVFFMAPVQHWADQLAGRAVANAKPHHLQTKDERMATYSLAASAAWADGVIDAQERALLDALRTSLSLPFEEAARIEGELARAQATADHAVQRGDRLP